MLQFSLALFSQHFYSAWSIVIPVITSTGPVLHFSKFDCEKIPRKFPILSKF